MVRDGLGWSRMAWDCLGWPGTAWEGRPALPGGRPSLPRVPPEDHSRSRASHLAQVPLRSIASFGGAFHCCTTDVRREGELLSYFPDIDRLQAAGEDCQFAPIGANAPKAYA